MSGREAWRGECQGIRAGGGVGELQCRALKEAIGLR